MDALKNKYVVIVGCGRVGAALAGSFSSRGAGVVVIDRHEGSFRALTAEFSGFRLDGDSSEAAVLEKAKMDKADIVVAATNDDNLNLMVAQFALHVFGVPKVLARIMDPHLEETARKLGIETVCPTKLALAAVMDRVSGRTPHEEDQ